MTIPVGGVRRPVTIVDCNGREVAISADGKLSVDASVSVPGDTPAATTESANLAVAALDVTDAVALTKEALWIALHVVEGGGLLAAEVFTVTLDSSDGPTFDTIIVRETLPIGTTDKFFSFPCDTLLRAGDHIRVQLANAGAPANNVNVTLMEGS